MATADTTTPARQQRMAVSQTEAAELLGVTTRTLNNWHRTGKLRGNRIGGGKRMYPVEALRKAMGKVGE
jgi:excisionase family DNA binding protein